MGWNRLYIASGVSARPPLTPLQSFEYNREGDIIDVINYLILLLHHSSIHIGHAVKIEINSPTKKSKLLLEVKYSKVFFLNII